VSDLIALATPRRQTRAAQHLGWLAGGTLTLYTAPQPASPEDPVTTQTAMLVYELPDPAGTAEEGIITGAAIADALASADGAPVWARARDASDATIGVYQVGLPGSGTALQIATMAVEAGDSVAIVSFTIVEG
jgi:hypothetical protein